jgi:uncharacterized protein
MLNPKNNFTVIVKTTYDCNMGCKYCYEGDKPPNTRIELQTIRNLIYKIVDYQSPDKPIKIIWHGGEPLLMGINFFKEVVRLQQSFSPKYEFENGIQTNGVLLSDKFIKFFMQNGFQIGLSLDGPPEIHDAQRLLGKGASFDKVFRAYTRTKNNGNERRKNISALAVFTHNTLKNLNGFYNFFKRNQINVKINPLLFAGNASRTLSYLIISPEEYGEALIYLFDMWLSEEKFTFTIEPFAAIIRSLVSGQPMACTFSGECFDKYLSIDPDGNIIPCGRWSKDTFMYGNINSIDSIASALTSSDMQRFRQLRKRAIEVCQNCPHRDICHGGCAFSGFMSNGDFSTPDYYCVSYKMLFTHIKNTLPMYLNLVDTSGGRL